MAIYNENELKSLLTNATDVNGDTITVREVEGSVRTFPYTFSLGGDDITVYEDGTVTLDDSDVTVGNPQLGNTVTSGTFTFSLWDGVDVSSEYTATVNKVGANLSITSTPVTSVTTISDEGVTWNFDTSVDAGQFVTGEWFIVVPSGSVGITSIAPASSGNENGAMINPMQPTTSVVDMDTGFSTSTSAAAFGGSLAYSSSVNVDPGNSGSTLSVTAGDGVQKAISGGGSISEYRFLTILDSVPPLNSFRPRQHGANGRTVEFSETDVDWTQLLSLSAPTGMNTPSWYLSNYKIDKFSWMINASNITRTFSPTNGQNQYGTSMGSEISQALLSLHSDVPLADKKQLAFHIIQKGLDALWLVEDIANTSYDRTWQVGTIGDAARLGRGFNGAGGNHAWAEQGAYAAATLINNAGLQALVGDSAPSEESWNANSSYFEVQASDVNRALYQKSDIGGFAKTYYFEDGHVGMPHWSQMHGGPDGVDFYGKRNDTANVAGSYVDINISAFFGTSLFLSLCPDGSSRMDYDPFYDMHDRVAKYILPNDYYYGSDSTTPFLNTANSVSAMERQAWSDWRGTSGARALYIGKAEAMIPPALSKSGNDYTVSKPPVNDGEQTVTSYEIRYRTTGTTSFSQGGGVYSYSEDQDGASGWTTATVTWDGSDEYSFTASGTHRVQIRVQNASGWGPWSTNNPVSTADTAPRAVL